MSESDVLFNVKNQYTQKLREALATGLYEGLKSLWDSTKHSSFPGEVYAKFQNNLTKVPKWNQDIVQREYKRIVDRSNCEWMDDLIKHVFKLETQYTASVDSRTALLRIKMTVPDTPSFIHQCYVNVARAFYLHVPLMEDRSQKITKLQELTNYELARAIIYEEITRTVTQNIPMKELSEESLSPHSESEPEDFDGSDDVDDDDHLDHMSKSHDSPRRTHDNSPIESPGGKHHTLPSRFARHTPDKDTRPSSPRHSPSHDASLSKPSHDAFSARPSPSHSVSSSRPSPSHSVSSSGPSPSHEASSSMLSASSLPEPSLPQDFSSARPSQPDDTFAFKSGPSSRSSSRSSEKRLPSPDNSAESWERLFADSPVKPQLETVQQMASPSPNSRRDKEIHFFSDAD